MKLEQVQPPEMAIPGRAPLWFGDRAAVAALVASAILWLLVWYGETVQSMVAVWQRSDTFAHGFLVGPISAWLIWQRRRQIAALEIRPNLLALPVLALVGLGWLLARFGGVAAAQQFGVVLMLPLMIWAILGNQMVRNLAFPLFFLLFAVPFGDFLEPLLMEHTADFTVAALRITGIPVYREGLFFTVPSGSWSIVEACSGLRYLIASLTVGVLYAYLTYRSLARRMIFVAISMIVPIIANWLRAYMIVMIGHLSNMKYAGGVDHVIYGWVFFGFVMLLLFWIGSYWREDLDPDGIAPAAVPETKPAWTEAPLTAVTTTVVVVAALVAAWPLAAAWLEGRNSAAAPVLEAPPQAGGWQLAGGPLAHWTPRFVNPRAQMHVAYAKDAMRGGLYVGYYRGQRPDAQLISTMNVIVSSTDREWKSAGESGRTLDLGGEALPVIETRLRGQSQQLLVWRWYWIDGQFTANRYWAKVLQAKAKVLGRGDDGAIVIVYAPYAERREAAERTMLDLVGGMLPAIQRSLENARSARPHS